MHGHGSKEKEIPVSEAPVVLMFAVVAATAVPASPTSVPAATPTLFNTRNLVNFPSVMQQRCCQSL